MKSLSDVQLFLTPWTVAHEAPPSMEFSSQEYWSGFPFPSPGDLLDPGIEPRSPTLQAEALPSEPPGATKESLVAKTVKPFACNAGDLASIPGWGRSPGEGNGNPLQYSCLENSMDRGAWRVTVHGVAKRQAQLSN